MAIAAISAAIWVAVIVASGAGWNPFAIGWNFANSGAFGDSFAPISTLMALIAAVGAIAAYRIQSEEISRIRAREAEIDQIAQSDRARLISRQELIDRQEQKAAFENTFFQLLKSHRELVYGLDLVNQETGERTVGHDVFRLLITQLKESLGERPRAVDVRAAWAFMSDFYRFDINHYFRTLYHIVRFIDKSQVENKYFYIQILRANLSEGEIALLALNCNYGEGREKFKDLVERYALLHNLTEIEVKYWKLKSKFAKGAFIYQVSELDFQILE